MKPIPGSIGIRGPRSKFPRVECQKCRWYGSPPKGKECPVCGGELYWDVAPPILEPGINRAENVDEQ